MPADNLIGTAAAPALLRSGGVTEHGLPQDLALNLGIGRAAYEAALDYAGLRVQGGRRI